VLSVLRRCPVPCIALAMGERGQITRLLAPKYGGFLTFGALSPERASGELLTGMRACAESGFSVAAVCDPCAGAVGPGKEGAVSGAV